MALLIIEHDPTETSARLGEVLRDHGHRLDICKPYAGDVVPASPDAYTGVVVMGGPMNVDQQAQHPWLADEIALIKAAHENKVAVLGICLGAQLLAKALGGDVSRNPVREIGWCDVHVTEAGRRDPVLSAFAPTQEVFQWHEDGMTVPPDVEVLASSPASPVQAFRHAEHVYGFQFHLEVNRPLIERWLTVPAHAKTLEEEKGRVVPEAIRRQTETSIGPLEALSRETFRRWIERFEMGPRRQRLPSR